ncbi:conserved hypothetical protein [Xanthomonas citri pv. fuscans]|nr:hypothetical protein XFF4834R_chr39130 [Xanthomonas citri pv. fuscans]SON78896.1 conserved hypothetical protein [Xanthomonas citri pv. fuscans]SON96484.1 conserved hypothetical protein [Xanthomonas citri pv. fuscans]SON99558.1 conserved hypothetical protein [Xanthomonas citri pv. fuscans]SOO05836.1 conserved hypothetical protein [Xanthomonas citri pv. fuscans]
MQSIRAQTLGLTIAPGWRRPSRCDGTDLADASLDCATGKRIRQAQLRCEFDACMLGSRLVISAATTPPFDWSAR